MDASICVRDVHVSVCGGRWVRGCVGAWVYARVGIFLFSISKFNSVLPNLINVLSFV